MARGWILSEFGNQGDLVTLSRSCDDEGSETFGRQDFREVRAVCTRGGLRDTPREHIGGLEKILNLSVDFKYLKDLSFMQ